MTINTEKTQAAVGWLKNNEIELKDISINIDNPKTAIIVTSLDKKPIAISKRILITAVGRLDRRNGAAEAISGIIKISNKSGSMTLSPLAGDGRGKTTITLEKQKGEFIVKLKPEMQTLWFLLQTE